MASDRLTGRDTSNGRDEAVSLAGGLTLSANVLSGADVAGNIQQTGFLEITSDTMTTSTTFIDLLSMSITTGANAVLIWFTCSFSMTAPLNFGHFRIVVDGTTKRAVAASIAASNDVVCAAIVYKDSVSSDSHTITIQWKVDSGTARIRPVADPDHEHASLLIIETKA